MAEHIYMFARGGIPVKFRAQSYLVGQIIDWFGRDVRFTNETDDTVDVSISVYEQAMIFWSLQYGQHVEILEPAGLRETIKSVVAEIMEKYR
jgi:predicted DNA-binding transcriptional regulator YafY